MKLLFEIYRILRELGIRTKDIIGVGKKIQQTGKTLFNTTIDPKILKIIYQQGKLSNKIIKEITEAAKGLRDTNAIQHRKFLVNIRQIKNAVLPEEAEVIDIATRAKIPASGIEKLKTRIQLDKNVLPFKEGEARWILDKAFKEGVFEFNPAEIKMIKGGKGDIIELFRSYYGSNAVRNLPAEGSVGSAHKFFKKLNNAVDENGFLKNHPKFNKEAIDWKKTQELTKKYGDRLDDHPFITEKELTKGFAEAKETFPRLDPENDAFIILDAKGNKMGRYEGRVTIDEITNKGVTQWWDKWDVKNKKLITDQSKYKFSGAVDDKGVEIIGAEGVIEGGKINISEHVKFIKSKEPIEAMKEANKVIKREGPYKNLTTDEAKQILKDTDDHIFQRDVVPGEFDPEYAAGGRIGLRTGTAKEIINLVVKHGPAFKKFADGLFIKASNAIRLGQGIFKNLTQSQRITQHDNLVKTIKTFEKKGTLEGTEQYFGIEAEKAFIAAQAKVKDRVATADKIKKGVADVMKDTSEAGLARSIEVDNLRLEFPGISDDLINNILTDMNPQRIAEVKQTMREAMVMTEKGMGTDTIIQTIKDSWKRKTQATGGRIGYRDGTILPQPKPEEVYLDEKLKKLQRAKKTILDNPGAFVDEEGKFTGEALIQSINNDIAQLRKEYVNIEKIPGLATGGVSNLFRRR